MRLRRDFQRGDEVGRQLGHVAAEVLVQAPGVVLDRVLLVRAVGHALLARVGPREGRLDAVGGVVGEGQRDGAGRRDRQQVRVADAVLADLLLDLGRQPGGEVAAGQVEVGVEEREGAALPGQFDGGEVGAVAHEGRDLGGLGARFLRVVAQPEHDEGVAEAGVTEPDAALGIGLGLLLRQRPVGGVEHVVQHARGQFHDAAEAGIVELGLRRERMRDEARQVDRAQAAAAVGRQRLFGAGVGGLDGLAVVEVVVAVDAVEEEDARLGVVVGRAHDLFPQLVRAHLAVDPAAVLALVGAGRHDVGGGLGLVRQFDVAVVLDCLHEGIRDADGDVEVGEVALVLGVDEHLDVRMVAAQHAHLGAAARAGGFHRLAGAVEDAHVGHRPRSARMRALDEGTDRTDRGEVVADAAAAAHGLGRLRQGGVDAGTVVDDLGDGIAHRLHEAVDQRGLQVGAGGGIDAAGRHEAVLLRFEEELFPMGAFVFGLDLGQGTCHAGAHVMHILFVAFGVFLEQDFAGNLLFCR